MYSQENRCCVCECGHLKSATKSQLALKCPDLSIGPIVSEAICGVLVKERKAPKYLKNNNNNTLHDYNSEYPHLEPVIYT